MKKIISVLSLASIFALTSCNNKCQTCSLQGNGIELCENDSSGTSFEDLEAAGWDCK